MSQFAVTRYYIENLKTPSKVLEIINEFGKVQGKNQYTKLAMYLYTNNRLYKKNEYNSTYNSINKIKILRNIFNQLSERKLYTENYKTVMKKVEEK